MNKITTAVIILLLVLTSSTSIKSLLKDRSTNQIVLHSNNLSSLQTQMNKYFLLGFRVTFMTNQSIAYDVSSHAYSARDLGYIQKGEVIVIMEK